MSSPELVLMLLADARLPVAGHTQSGQLEPAVAGGLAADEVPGFVRSRLASVVRVEAAAAVVALHCLRGGAEVSAVESAWAARTPSSAMRSTSRTQARALLRLADRLWPGAVAVRAVRALPTAPRPVALAAVAATAGLSPLQLARLIGYDDVQTVCAAALKLLPLDPAAVSVWVLDALPWVEVLAADVAPLTRPGQLPALGSPRIEAWAEAHAATTRRLFSA